MGRSENWSDDLWIGEMGLSARNGKTVDRRNESGSEKNEIGVRNGRRKLTMSVDWIGAWIVSGSEWIGAIFVECLEWIGAWIVSGSEWIGVIFVECVELGSWADRSGSERFSSSASSLDRERIGAWLRRAWIVVRRCGWFPLARCVGRSSEGLTEAVCVWETRACERGEEKIWSENNDWNQFQSFLADFSVKLKTFSVWPNFTEQPNALFSGNWFPKINFSQNKRSLSLFSFPSIWSCKRFCFKL